ncbi:hypothetical protein ElyMa_000642400 [Elysia marginata]|uniref:Uncharacterized protein n=1 Tax=Elysia marginata TaxID=1093978 RepID=A0AAV4GEQ1_9GAST|nr:hypothetical protein ElyMa_000642400 [Elysia marginata]
MGLLSHSANFIPLKSFNHLIALGNDVADQLAKEGGMMEQIQHNPSYNEAKTLINSALDCHWRQEHPQHNSKDAIHKLSRAEQGTFSFSAGIPTTNNQVKWSTEIDHRNGSDAKDTLSFQGCVSDQQTIVCATSRGYVSLDPENGNILWNYTTRTAPYLPVMDVFGDVIGMDKDNLYYVGADGKPKHPISIKILQPAFSLMVANNSILFLTSTSTKTGQVVTYGTGIDKYSLREFVTVAIGVKQKSFSLSTPRDVPVAPALTEVALSFYIRVPPRIMF